MPRIHCDICGSEFRKGKTFHDHLKKSKCMRVSSLIAALGENKDIEINNQEDRTLQTIKQEPCYGLSPEKHLPQVKEEPSDVGDLITEEPKKHSTASSSLSDSDSELSNSGFQEVLVTADGDIPVFDFDNSDSDCSDGIDWDYLESQGKLETFPVFESVTATSSTTTAKETTVKRRGRLPKGINKDKDGKACEINRVEERKLRSDPHKSNKKPLSKEKPKSVTKDKSNTDLSKDKFLRITRSKESKTKSPKDKSLRVTRSKESILPETTFSTSPAETCKSKKRKRILSDKGQAEDKSISRADKKINSKRKQTNKNKLIIESDSSSEEESVNQSVRSLRHNKKKIKVNTPKSNSSSEEESVNQNVRSLRHNKKKVKVNTPGKQDIHIESDSSSDSDLAVQKRVKRRRIEADDKDDSTDSDSISENDSDNYYVCSESENSSSKSETSSSKSENSSSESEKVPGNVSHTVKAKLKNKIQCKTTIPHQNNSKSKPNVGENETDNSNQCDSVVPVPGSNAQTEVKSHSFVCGICKTTFSSSETLMKHIYSHNAPEVIQGISEFICGVCSNVYACNEDLQNHMMEHMKPQENVYQVQDRVDSGNSKLSDGIYVCGKCNESFSDFQTLNSHMATHLNIIIMSEEEDQDEIGMENVDNEDTEEDSSKCVDSENRTEVSKSVDSENITDASKHVASASIEKRQECVNNGNDKSQSVDMKEKVLSVLTERFLSMKNNKEKQTALGGSSTNTVKAGNNDGKLNSKTDGEVKLEDVINKTINSTNRTIIPTAEIKTKSTIKECDTHKTINSVKDDRYITLMNLLKKDTSLITQKDISGRQKPLPRVDTSSTKTNIATKAHPSTTPDSSVTVDTLPIRAGQIPCVTETVSDRVRKAETTATTLHKIQTDSVANPVNRDKITAEVKQKIDSTGKADITTTLQKQQTDSVANNSVDKQKKDAELKQKTLTKLMNYKPKFLLKN